MIEKLDGTNKMVCPEDGEKVDLKDASLANFPKNIALTKIIEMKKDFIGEKDHHLRWLKLPRMRNNKKMKIPVIWWLPLFL